MSDTGGIRHHPTLDGTQLFGINPEVFQEQPLVQAETVVMADGGGRLQSTYIGAGYPNETLEFQWEVRYRYLRDYKRLVNWLLARGGTHTLTMWRHVEHAYEGDGSRSEFYTPWRHAKYHFGAGNGPRDDTTFTGLAFYATTDPADKLGKTVVEKTTAQYDAGTPAAGELWVDTEDATAPYRMKLDAALADGSYLYVSYVPVFTVIAQTTGSEQPGPVREPKTITFRTV